MSEPKYRWIVGLSYHTRTDSDLANVLKAALASVSIQGLSLPYLNISGYGVVQSDNPEGMRKDGWVNHFLDILEGSIGMIVLSTRESVVSEQTPWRGMWIESNLAHHLALSDPEFLFRLEHPSMLKPATTQKPEEVSVMIDELVDLKTSSGRRYDAAEGRIAYLESAIADNEARLLPPLPLPALPDPKDWAQQVLPILEAWIGRRENVRIPKASRFLSDQVNEKGYLDSVEVGRTFSQDVSGNEVPGTFYWYWLAALDLYECVWICRRCFSASDVWMRVESRPPRSCPNCGYVGRQNGDTI
jgi:hypothetical protein